MGNEADRPARQRGAQEKSQGTVGQLVQLLGTDTLRYLPAAIVPAGISVASIAIFTRLFDSLDYGRYALVISTTTITIMLLSGWIGQSVLRYLPRFKAEERLGEFVVKLAVVVAGVVLVATIVALLVKTVFGPRLGAYAPFLLAAWLLVLAEIVFSSLGSAYQANMMSKDYTIFKVTGSVLRLSLALLYVLYVTRDIKALVLAGAVAQLVLVIPMAVRFGVGRHLRMRARPMDPAFLKMLAAYGIPMMGWMIASQVLALSDRFVIAAFRSDSEVGIYSATYNLVSMGFGLVSGPILIACYPIIISAWERGNRKEIPALLTAFSRYYLLAVLPIVLTLSVFSREIVSILLGSDFREGYTIVPFVIAGVAAWGLSMVGHKGLEILEKTGLMLRLVGIAAGLNIVLNLVVVPRYGYQGAAATTMISYLSYPVMVWFVTREGVRWSLARRSTVNLAVAGMVMMAVLVGSRLLLPDLPALALVAAGALAGLLAYAGALILLKEIDLH